MKNAFLNRTAWMAGISVLVVLSGCGGGGSGTERVQQQPSVWEGRTAIGAVQSIDIIRVDGNPVGANTVLQISKWTCATTGEKPVVSSEVSSEVVQTATGTATFDALRFPADKLLVRIMNGNSPYYPGEASVYYAKLHDMTTAGDSSGKLTIRFDAVPDTDEELAAQFDTCP